MKKRYFISALSVVLAFSLMSNTSFAAGAEVTGCPAASRADGRLAYAPESTLYEPDGVPAAEPSNVRLIYDPEQPDVIVQTTARDLGRPTEMFNLDGRNYSIDGRFKEYIYTMKCFYPNAKGELYIAATFDWGEQFFNQSVAGIKCWDKTTGKLLDTIDLKFDLPQSPNGMYGPTIDTGTWRIYNLQSDHLYYFEFYKTADGISAKVTGTISTSYIT